MRSAKQQRSPTVTDYLVLGIDSFGLTFENPSKAKKSFGAGFASSEKS